MPFIWINIIIINTLISMIWNTTREFYFDVQYTILKSDWINNNLKN